MGIINWHTVELTHFVLNSERTFRHNINDAKFGNCTMIRESQKIIMIHVYVHQVRDFHCNGKIDFIEFLCATYSVPTNNTLLDYCLVTVLFSFLSCLQRLY